MSDAPALSAPVDGFDRLDDMPVRVTAVVGRARVAIGDLIKADAGTVIDLDRKSGDPVDLYVNESLVGRGQIVMVGDRLAIEMTEIIEQAK